MSSNQTRLMESFIKQYDKECMKMALLKHEETFRQQVHELHRLYRVQKILMNDLKKLELKRQWMSADSQTHLERGNAENKTVPNQPYFGYQDQEQQCRTLDLELPAEEYIGKDNGDLMLEVEESDLELTLATGSRRRKKKEASFTSDSAASFSSSSAESSGVKRNGNDWILFQVPDVNTSFQSEAKRAFDVEEQMRQDRMKHPPWLFQCLSLNMT